MSPVLQVQRTLGNQAAQRFLQADTELKKAKRRARILRRWLTRIAKNEPGDVAVSPWNVRRAGWVKLLQDAGEPDFTRLSDRERAHIDRLTAVRFEDPEPIEVIGEGPAEPAEPADGPVVAAPEKPQPCAAFEFTGGSPERDLAWEDFHSVGPGALDPADAQVDSNLITRDAERQFAARLGGRSRVERGKQTQSLLEHEQIHWKITCKIVQLANAEVARGSDYADVYRVANAVFRDLNDHATGLYDTDTGHGVSDAIPKFDWPKEWCKVVEDRWEETVRDEGIRTITL